MQNQIEYLQSNDVLKVRSGISDERIFHILDRSTDVNVLYDLLANLKICEEVDLEEGIILDQCNGKYGLFIYPVTGDGDDAKIGR